MIAIPIRDYMEPQMREDFDNIYEHAKKKLKKNEGILKILNMRDIKCIENELHKYRNYSYFSFISAYEGKFDIELKLSCLYYKEPEYYSREGFDRVYKNEIGDIKDKILTNQRITFSFIPLIFYNIDVPDSYYYNVYDMEKSKLRKMAKDIDDEEIFEITLNLIDMKQYDLAKKYIELLKYLREYMKKKNNRVKGDAQHLDPVIYYYFVDCLEQHCLARESTDPETRKKHAAAAIYYHLKGFVESNFNIYSNSFLYEDYGITIAIEFDFDEKWAKNACKASFNSLICNPYALKKAIEWNCWFPPLIEIGVDTPE